MEEKAEGEYLDAFSFGAGSVTSLCDKVGFLVLYTERSRLK
jgi:hypothetical protein